MLRPLPAVLDLDGQSEPTYGDSDGMHPFRPDFRDDVTVSLLEHHRVESIGAPEQERATSHRAQDATWNLLTPLGRRGEAGKRGRHRIQREPEGRHAAPIDGDEHAVRGNARPSRHHRERGTLHRVLRSLISKGAFTTSNGDRKSTRLNSSH